MIHRPQAVAIAALVLATGTGGQAALAANYTLTVNAAMQTAGNPRFWAASVGTGTASLTLRSDLQTHYKLANRELGMQRVRGHGVLNDDIGVYRGPGSYDWTKFDTYLSAITAAGMRPIMELSFMPTALGSSATNPSRSPPKDINAYRQFIQAVVQHCVDRFGAADVSQWYWEVWNEWDYPSFWTGTEADYYTLYDAAVDGASAVLPNILIGGPASTEPGKISRFLQHTKTANKRVTFVSSHSYPGGNGTAAPNATGLINDNNSRLSQITAGGYTTATVKSFNTEWNSAYAGQGGNPGDANLSMDNHWNAGFILKAVKLFSDRTQGNTPVLDVFSYWVVSDIFDESGGPSGSYILGQGGNLPFGRVFGLMTFQGVRKAAFNAFKMLNYLGPKRLMSAGGVAGDGVDGLATMAATDDEVQVLVYNYFATANTTGSDTVTVTVNNLPAALAGKELFVTHFRVDETHSNPYSVWVGQNSPTNPTEAQWQAMRQAQHLALLQPVSKATVTSAYTTSFTLPRQAGSLVIIGLKRPVVGRNALVEIEGEDYDGQSAATKQDSADTTLGQSISGNSGSYLYFENVDFSDVGVDSVQLRVAAQAATTLELHADAQTGPMLGRCQLTATGGAWATQTCALTHTSGVGRLFVVFGGTARLNWLKFQAATVVGSGMGGMNGGLAGQGGAMVTGGDGGGITGTGGSGDSGGMGGMIVLGGAGGANLGLGGSSGDPGSSGAGGASAEKAGGGCSCGVAGAGRPFQGLLVVLVALGLAGIVRRRR